MTDWAGEQKLVYDDIKSEGFEVTVRNPGSPGVFDPDSMEWSGATDPTDTTTYAIRKEYSLKEVDGTIIQRNDSVLVVPAYGLPDDLINEGTSYQVLIGSVEQNVIHIGPVAPGNVTLLYNVQVRE